MGGSVNAIKQKPLLTPELCQAITILTMATVDLVRYIENAVLENPMLEVVEDADVVEEAARAPEREDFTLDWCTLLAECGQIDSSFDHTWPSRKTRSSAAPNIAWPRRLPCRSTSTCNCISPGPDPGCGRSPST